MFPMPISVDEIIASLDPDEKREVERLTGELHSQLSTCQRLNEARERARTDVARELGMNRDEMRRLERKCDLFICALRETIEEGGGTLSLVVAFPDGKPLELAAIGEHDDS